MASANWRRYDTATFEPPCYDLAAQNQNRTGGSNSSNTNHLQMLRRSNRGRRRVACYAVHLRTMFAGSSRFARSISSGSAGSILGGPGGFSVFLCG